MTKFTPNYNWPVAEDIDIVKQFPTTVDDPFKSALDSDLGSMFGSPGKRLIVATSTAAASGSGGLTVQFAGGFVFGAIPVVVATLGDETSAAGYIQLVNSSITVSQFAVRVIDRSGNPVTSGTFRINYVALGPISGAATQPSDRPVVSNDPM